MAKDLSLNRNSQQDNNQQYSIIGVQGTAGTADTLGTAPTIPIAVDPTTGAMYVNNLGASGTSGGGGTVVTVDHGTITPNGTLPVSQSGAFNVGGTLTSAGTVTGVGVVSSLTAGTVATNLLSGTLNAGTVTVTGGTINAATATISGGTINAGTMVNNGGTINLATVTMTLGTINASTVNLGTVVGKDADNAATTSFPVLSGGVFNGTAHAFRTDTNGNLITVGTINAGTVTVTGGTVNASTATVNAGANSNAGTFLAVRLTDGTSYYTATGGTGSSGGGTVVTVDHGTVIVSGNDADNVATTTFPVLTGGLFNGTAHAFRTDTNGNIITVGTLNAGTINAGTFVANGGTIANLAGGTVQTNLLSGTLNLATVVPNGGTVGTVPGVGVVTTVSGITTGTINLATVVPNGGTVGTVPGVGVVTTVTTVSNLTNGSVKVTAGTETITAGTINLATVTMTLGTINSGTINASTVNTGTINAATVNAATANLQPFPATQIQSAGTVSTGTIGTLVAAAGAGIGIYPTNLVVNASSGTPDVVVSFALQASGNQVVNRGVYTPTGGAVIPFPYPSFYGTSNAALTWNVLSGAGTISLSVLYATKGTP